MGYAQNSPTKYLCMCGKTVEIVASLFCRRTCSPKKKRSTIFFSSIKDSQRYLLIAVRFNQIRTAWLKLIKLGVLYNLLSLTEAYLHSHQTRPGFFKQEYNDSHLPAFASTFCLISFHSIPFNSSLFYYCCTACFAQSH